MTTPRELTIYDYLHFYYIWTFRAFNYLGHIYTFYEYQNKFHMYKKQKALKQVKTILVFE